MKLRQVQLVFMSVFVLSGALLAQVPHVSGNDALKTFLNLTADQATFVEQEFTTLQQRSESLFAELGQVRARCEDAMQAGDSALVGNLTLQAKSVENQIAAERRTYRDRVQAILTPAQTEKLKVAQEVSAMIRANPGALEPLLFERMFMREYRPGGLLRHAPREPVHSRKQK